jgi:hypothetical protein
MSTTTIAETSHEQTTVETTEGEYGYHLTRYSMADITKMSEAQIDAIRTVVVDGWCFSTSNEVGTTTFTIRCWRHDNPNRTINDPVERHELDGWVVSSRLQATRLGLMAGVLGGFQRKENNDGN